MFTYLKYLLRTGQPNHFTGANIDTRSPQAKAEDIVFDDIVGKADAVLWKEKWPNVRRYPDYNQYRSFTCGANALSKSQGIHFALKYGYLPFSRPDIYQRRTNRPGEGMIMWDMFEIASKWLVPTSFTAEEASNLLKDTDYEALPIDQWAKDINLFSVKGNVKLANDLETIASVIQTTGKAPILLTYFTAGEWSKEIPYIVESTLKVMDSSALRHFVTIVDFTLHKGVKYLVVEDSAWFGGYNRRLLSEEWIKIRGYEIRYGMNFRFEPKGDKPSYDGVTIISAQECLRYLSYFPSNISLVEALGPITRQSLSKFQRAQGLPVTSKLDPLTVRLLRDLFP